MKKTTKIPQPLHDRVILSDPPLLKKASTDSVGGHRISDKMVGGIIIPDSAEASTIAAIEDIHFVLKVLAVGHECKVVKLGQRVVVMRKDLFPMKVEGKSWTLIREAYVCAVL